MNEPLARSARDGVPAQTYRAHTKKVVYLAIKFGREATMFSPKYRQDFLAALEMAAVYHDLGKLDEIFQDVLRRNLRERRLNHVDAGVAHLLTDRHAEAAVAAYSHHIGLPSFQDERTKNANGLNGMFRDLEGTVGDTGLKTYERTNTKLADYLGEHCKYSKTANLKSKPGFTGLARRLLLSCLVDADHSDAAQSCKNEFFVEAPKLRAFERLPALDSYVSSLAKKAKPKTKEEQLRHKLRQQIYKACRECTVAENKNVLSCDSPVGTGKTTAVMAHLLRVAAERRLRRIFVVLPYTNIIDQSVDVYREALRLSDETKTQMSAVVAAHHHRVEYKNIEFRQLSARWDSPVVVTTAVQFFETLSANTTASLRKLHQLTGSAIFIDEAHAVMPPALWPRMFRWLRELCDDWGCHLVLASGSLARFWELADFVPANERKIIPELVSPKIALKTQKFEKNRVNFYSDSNAFSMSRLAEFVLSKPGPKLIILNTVQSAAVFANYLRQDCQLGLDVEHISTALTPLDRVETVRRVKERLLSSSKDWCLVATSCVEAGVNFSFRSAFRERWGLVNLLQIAGRVNRSGEYSEVEVWDFIHDGSGGLSHHPQADIPRDILARLFEKCAQESRQPSPADCTEALRLELRNDRGHATLRIEEIEHAEKNADYPEVARLCRIIDASTQTVIVKQGLIERIQKHNRLELPTWQEIMGNSVQIYSNRLNERVFPVKQIGHNGEFWGLIDGNYDEFVGWMKGMLPLLKSSKGNGFVL